MQNSQGVSQTNPLSVTEEPLQNTSSSKIRLYEFLMTLIFLVFAIPLFLFFFKDRFISPKENILVSQSLQPLTTGIPQITITPTPILLKTSPDLVQIKKDLYLDLSPDQFQGISNQFEVAISELQQ